MRINLSRLALLALVAVAPAAALAQTQINQSFILQGPAPSFGPVDTVQSQDSPPNGSVSGAVQALVIDPALGANTMFIGAPNGGIWRTTDGGANWAPLTDKQASLSIASLAIDPTDPTGKTLVAGVGITSNGLWDNSNGAGATGRGGQRTGLLYTTDGGTTWTPLGGAALAGQSVIGVAARGSTILAATFEEHDATLASAAYGLYRSINGGASFTQVAPGSGLPAGPVTSLVADPANPSRFFAAITSPANPAATSIYVSNNGGASWSPVFSNATVIAGGANIIPGSPNQLVIKLATGPGNSVAAAFADRVTGTLVALYLSQNSGASWSQLGTPPTNAGSQQAVVNLSLAIDTSNPGIVYVAGDVSAAPPHTLAAFRVQGAAFTSLTEAGFTASGSSAHGDSRVLVMNAAGNLVMGSDGGVYIRTSPQTTTGDWQGLNTGTLQIRESSNIAYGANSKRLVVAAQDTGAAIQSAPGSPFYAAIQPADGTNAVASDQTFANRSTYYTSFQTLGGLSRLILDRQGNTVSPAGPTPAGVTVTCDGGNTCSNQVTGAQHASPFVLNKIDQSRIAMGGTSLYVTRDTAPANAATVDLTLTNVGAAGAIIRTISYGTRDNANVILVGTDDARLFVSTTSAAGSIIPGAALPAYTGLIPTSTVFDLRSQNRFFVADSQNLWATVNQGATINNLTANLPANIIRPTSVEFINNNGVNALLTGGLSNVANAQSQIAVADSNAIGILSNWRLFGSGLPNALVWQMSYNPIVDVLAVAAVGRGIGTLYDVTSYFPQATVLQFGLADNNSVPDASFLTNGTVGNRPLIKYGTGTLTIGGNATYTGGTTIDDGVLQIGAAGSILGNVSFCGNAADPLCNATTNKFLVFNRSDTSTFGGSIAGLGQLVQAGAGTTVLTGSSTYTGGTTISAGTLQLGNGGATGSIAGDVTDNGIFAVNRSDSFTFAGLISGTGAFQQLGSGTTILTAANTYAGGTTISAGTLQLGNGGAAGSFLGNVVDNGVFAINRSDTFTFGAAISGTGSFEQRGAGMTVLTGANTYAGGTTITAGTLQLGNGGTTGSILGNVTDNGVFVFNRSDIYTFAGVISGTGAVQQLGTGTTALTGADTYTGGTTINNGVLQIGAAGTAGSIVGNVSFCGNAADPLCNATTNKFLVFNRSDTSTFGGTIAGPGQLVQAGAGTTILTGSSIYTGGTTISAGTLQLGNGGAAGSIAGNVTDIGIFAVNRSDSFTFAGLISGTGAFQQLGSGTTILTAGNTYTGGTTISAGTLQLGTGGAAGSIVGNVIDNGVFAVNRSDTFTFGAAISGTGSFEQRGAGTTVLTGSNTYAGGTTIAAGMLQLGNGGTAGSILGNVTDNGVFAVNRSDAYTFAGLISGNGAVRQLGTGTTILTAANTYTGGTTINNGMLQIGAGGTAGSIVGNVSFCANAADPLCNATTSKFLVLNRSDTSTFGGSISGPGQLVQAGAGKTILTGGSTYTGPTSIIAGNLTVRGSIISAVSVNAGGTLSGSGSVGPTTVLAGGTLAPGDPNTLTINGGLTFNAGSNYLVAVAGPASDRTNVNGAAALAGNSIATFTGTNLATRYAILTATGGDTGTFAGFTPLGLPPFLTASLAYLPTEVDINLASGLGTTAGLNRNQRAVGGALDISFNNGGGTLLGLFGVPAGQLPAALGTLSGEGVSGTQETAFGASDLFLSTMMQQGAFWRSGDELDPIGVAFAALNYAPDKSQSTVFKAVPKAPIYQPRTWRAWTTGFDASYRLDGEQGIGSADLSHRTGGVAGGFDHQVNPNLLVGFALGGTASTFSVPDRLTAGTVSGGHLGTYGVATWGSFYAAGALSFAAFDNRINRTIAGVGATETTNGGFASDMFSGRVEIGQKWTYDRVAVTPFAAVQFSELWQRGFAETSAVVAGTPGVLGLNVASRAVSSVPTFLGAQLDTRVVLANGMAWSPYLRASWVHEFNPTRNITATFETLPLAGFTVDGPRAASDAGRLEAGAKLAIARNAWLHGSIEGELSSRSQVYAGKGGLKVAW